MVDPRARERKSGCCTMEFQPSGKSVLNLIGAFSDLQSFALDNPKFDVINGLLMGA
jgi:hypothetical protein